jgi:hypothetical protein
MAPWRRPSIHVHALFLTGLKSHPQLEARRSASQCGAPLKHPLSSLQVRINPLRRGSALRPELGCTEHPQRLGGSTRRQPRKRAPGDIITPGVGRPSPVCPSVSVHPSVHPSVCLSVCLLASGRVQPSVCLTVPWQAAASDHLSGHSEAIHFVCRPSCCVPPPPPASSVLVHDMLQASIPLPAGMCLSILSHVQDTLPQTPHRIACHSGCSQEPLLGKAAGSGGAGGSAAAAAAEAAGAIKRSERRRATITALLRMSAADAPLLFLV